MRLVGQSLLVVERDNHSSCRYCFVLQDLLRTQYTPHLLFTEFREILVGIRKLIEGMTIKINIDWEPLNLDEPEVVDKPEPNLDEPEVVDKSEPEPESKPEPEAVDKPKPEPETVDEPDLEPSVLIEPDIVDEA